MGMDDYRRWIAAGNNGRDYIGPPSGDACGQCNRRPAFRCEGCGESFCQAHWWRHSHQVEVPAAGGN